MGKTEGVSGESQTKIFECNKGVIPIFQKFGKFINSLKNYVNFPEIPNNFSGLVLKYNFTVWDSPPHPHTFSNNYEKGKTYIYQ